METLTLEQFTIRGSVLGKPVRCALRTSPAGLKLPPGDYWLQLAPNNAVFGQVLALQPIDPSGETALRGHPIKAPGEYDLKPAAREGTRAPMAVATLGTPSALKFTPAAAVEFYDAPAIKFDKASGLSESVVISDRAIGSNSFVIMNGYGDLFEAVQRAGGVRLVVV